MRLVTLSLGSNIEREHHITVCLDALADTFGQLAVSRVFESTPVGFEDGRNFFNLVVALHCDWSVGELQAWCKRLESANGRSKDSPKFSPRTLDVDILTVDSLTGEVDGVSLPRGEILHHAFVLWPMAELLPDHRHPVVGRRYQELWQAFDDGSQQLWPVEFHWRGEALPLPSR
ncbi:2-amino-4-hydroxy-6-hydroxymethyldihydropteridine diphosphokinase [Halomonas denitrificans]|uniref:2-amino-4-hydroxy-6- hydroxymethyldihydropteridine diphosphokinase n=1 Tax=Halomonas denitrificans TaxID=370769 RepID=UPI001C99204E|nr:2-amino-4-hydroxy-6-hydroxymethyldihydropteridine diphosphokinase [Halomonas denitrificans]MBY5968545.1 2-amino-4-hydroxy-6-hydroxymethyldihydropteridine diphosphokinase [Halomonas denitrificans]MCA0975416.1 2-amino-4-hydroxy-6-hydroxymethyldihydropteridine diphosphokinase [Halomonas denitrificans]